MRFEIRCIADAISNCL